MKKPEGYKHIASLKYGECYGDIEAGTILYIGNRIEKETGNEIHRDVRGNVPEMGNAETVPENKQ